MYHPNSIVYLNLSARTENALRRSGVQDVDHLAPLTLEQIRAIRGIGIKGQDEIRQLRAVESAGRTTD